MPDVIRLLSDKIANRIAAGEVVQRPASVVKEILENALDAGATRIRLKVANAGKTLIQVHDNGKGMSDTDARMCFERHATSKIRSVEDLEAIQTMGFRGEALASIASVAQVELQTKSEADTVGTKIRIAGSQIESQEPVACNQGTILTIKNLFYNTPARHKFLKSDAVELRHIQDEFLRIALAYPETYFSLVHNDKEVFNLPVSTLKQRIINALGRTLEDKLIRIEEDTELVKISGFIVSPASAKKRRGDQYFFVNNRFFKSPYLHHAIRTAYSDLLAPEAHPGYVVFLDLDPSRVDVNVHPSKQEVKFEDERILYNYLRVAARHALASSQAIPSLDFERSATGGFDAVTGSAKGDSWSPRPSTEREDNNLSAWQELYNLDESASSEPSADSDTGLFSDQESHRAFSLTPQYLCVPVTDGAVLIDRSAAEAKLIYDSLLRSIEGTETIARQRELFPRQISLSPSDASLMPDLCKTLNSFGFELEEFGNHSWINHSVPAISMVEISLEPLITELLDDMKSNRPKSKELGSFFAGRLAKKLVKKRWSRATSQEILHLFDRLQSADMHSLEPLGRKCLIHLDLDELKKLFRG